MKNHHVSFNRMLKTTSAMTAGLMVACVASSAMALPQGGVVAQGQATIQAGGNQMNITQGTNKAVINWQQFDIGAGETTRFVQPSANAIALNRVTGSQNPSQILGSLTANGRVVIVNPNGVLFGKGSKTDVAGLIASTADMSDKDFLNDQFRFNKPGRYDAKIINEGSISAKDGGLVALVAPGVENRGVIRANQGKVALAGGQKATLDFYGDNLIGFTVDGESQGINNSGVISAPNGDVYMTAKTASAVVDNVINTTGLIEATSSRVEGGVIVLDGGQGGVNVSGSVKADNSVGKGGKITVTGRNVNLNKATVDASGKTDGGAIKIGGDVHGVSAFKEADSVVVDSASVLRADGFSGKGGDVVVWSETATRFDGSISATGGTDGGFAEVSSKGLLGFNGAVDLSGATGANGTLLLDPGTAIIANNPADDNALDGDETVLEGDGGGSVYHISANAVETALNLGHVIIEAMSRIIVASVIDVSGSAPALGHDLTLKADRVDVNANISLNQGDLKLLGDEQITLKNGVALSAENIRLLSNGIVEVFGNLNADLDITLKAATRLFLSGQLNGHVVTDADGLSADETSSSSEVRILNNNVSVQTGIDIVDTGGSVLVEPGIYNEALTIDKDLTLRGTGTSDEVIFAPDDKFGLRTMFSSFDGVETRSIIHVKDASATIFNLTVDGSNVQTGFGANERLAGITFDHAGGVVHDVNVQHVYDDGAFQGVGIFVDNGNAPVFETKQLRADSLPGGEGESLPGGEEASPRELLIRDTEITDFQSSGIHVHGEGLGVNIRGNTIVGNGLDAAQAQTGIYLTGNVGAGAIVTDGKGNPIGGSRVVENTISEIGTDGSVGILIDDVASDFIVYKNSVNGDGSLVDISGEEGNPYREALTTGILVREGGLNISGNQVRNFGTGVDIEGNGTTLSGGTYTDNGKGILIDNADATILTDVTVSGADPVRPDQYGLYIDGPEAFVTFADNNGSSFSNFGESSVIFFVNDAMDDLDLAVNTVTFPNGERGDVIDPDTGENFVWDENDNSSVGDVLFPRGGDTTPGGENTTPGGGDTTPGGGGDTTPGGGDTTPGGGDTTPGGGDTTPGGGDTPSGGAGGPSTFQALTILDEDRNAGFFAGLFSYYGKTLGSDNSLDGTFVNLSLLGASTGGTFSSIGGLTPGQLGGIEPAAGPGVVGQQTVGDQCVDSYLSDGFQTNFDATSCKSSVN